jgi:hypothetical protein
MPDIAGSLPRRGSRAAWIGDGAAAEALGAILPERMAEIRADGAESEMSSGADDEVSDRQ